MFSIHTNVSVGKKPGFSAVGAGLLFNGLLCILFALAIFSAPELLAYFIATLLLIMGISLLATWWKFKQVGKSTGVIDQ